MIRLTLFLDVIQCRKIKVINYISKYNKRTKGQRSYCHLNRCRELFWQSQLFFTINAPERLRVEGTYFKLIKARYFKPVLASCEMGKTHRLFTKSRIRQEYPLPSPLFKWCLMFYLELKERNKRTAERKEKLEHLYVQMIGCYPRRP